MKVMPVFCLFKSPHLSLSAPVNICGLNSDLVVWAVKNARNSPLMNVADYLPLDEDRLRAGLLSAEDFQDFVEV